MIEKTNILEDVIEIAGRKVNQTVRLKAEIIIKDKVLNPIAISGGVILSDFMKSYTDKFYLKVLLPTGTFQYDIYPFRDDIEIYLYTTRRGKTTLKKYRGIILNYSDKTVEANDEVRSNKNSMNVLSMEEHIFQLMEFAMEKIRTVEVGGQYLASTPENLLRTVMGSQMNALGLNGDDKFKGMDIFPIDNSKLRNQFIIKPGVKLTDMPGFLQNEEGIGLYNQDVGYYFREGYWYVWPLFHTRRYTEVPDAVTLANIPPKRIPTVDNTYDTVDGHIYILSTGETRQADPSVLLHYESGNGARVISADSVAGDTGMVVDRGKVLKVRSESVSEYKTVERDTKVDYAPIHTEVTNNLFKVRSRNAVMDGSFMTMNWQNSDPLMVRPGAPLRYFYAKGDGMGIRFGTVIKMETHFDVANGSLVDPVFNMNTGLTVFIENKDDE